MILILTFGQEINAICFYNVVQCRWAICSNINLRFVEYKNIDAIGFPYWQWLNALPNLSAGIARSSNQQRRQRREIRRCRFNGKYVHMYLYFKSLYLYLSVFHGSHYLQIFQYIRVIVAHFYTVYNVKLNSSAINIYVLLHIYIIFCKTPYKKDEDNIYYISTWTSKWS